MPVLADVKSLYDRNALADQVLGFSSLEINGKKILVREKKT